MDFLKDLKKMYNQHAYNTYERWMFNDFLRQEKEREKKKVARKKARAKIFANRKK